jgi:hypothetical protein
MKPWFNKNKTVLMATLLLGLSNCNNQTKTEQNASINATNPSIKKTMETKQSERLILTGDFDGNGTIDTVYESYISSLTGQETNKNFATEDWVEEIELTIKNKPICRIYSSIHPSDTFVLTNEHQQKGVAYFENLGDLNNDKGDEIGYMIDWADFSNLNTFHVKSFKNKKGWIELFSFTVNEAISFEPENLFEGKFIVIKSDSNKVNYKFYGNEGSVEESEITFE